MMATCQAYMLWLLRCTIGIKHVKHAVSGCMFQGMILVFIKYIRVMHR